MNQQVSWSRVAGLPLTEDMQTFVLWLQQQGVQVTVVEEGNEQCLYINDQEKVLEVRGLLEQWQAGDLILKKSAQVGDAHKQNSSGNIFSTIFLNCYQCPVTIVFIVLGFLGALLVELNDVSGLLSWFLFQAPDERGVLSFEYNLLQGHYWRLVTPVFIHFGFMHILFNALICWELGKKFEITKGSLHLLLVFLFAAIVTNFAQYVSSPNAFFGGLSGINYALIGYVAVYQRHIKHPILCFSQAMIIFFVGWLLLGVFGVVDVFIEGSIANAAHVSGLVLGLCVGYVIAKVDLKKSRSSSLDEQ